MNQREEILMLWELGQRGHLLGTPNSRADAVRDLEGRLTDPTLKDLASRLWASLKEEISIGTSFFLRESHQERISILGSLRQKYLEEGGQPYLYHGTTLGKLEGILEQGLRPGQSGNWKQSHLASHCAEHVFLTQTPDAAADWAIMAQQRGRGPRGARNRRPIVLRIPLLGFQVEQDTRSANRDSVMTSAVVPVTDAMGAYACTPELTWLPLSDMAKQKSLATYLDPFKMDLGRLSPA